VQSTLRQATRPGRAGLHERLSPAAVDPSLVCPIIAGLVNGTVLVHHAVTGRTDERQARMARVTAPDPGELARKDKEAYRSEFRSEPSRAR
jgi:hypothetical protein